MTARVFAECVQKFKHKQSQRDIARELGASPSTVGRRLHFIPSSGADKLPKVLSIDEFKGNTEYGKFQAILTDPVGEKAVDILKTRNSSEIKRFCSDDEKDEWNIERIFKRFEEV